MFLVLGLPGVQWYHTWGCLGYHKGRSPLVLDTRNRESGHRTGLTALVLGFARKSLWVIAYGLQGTRDSGRIFIHGSGAFPA